MIGSWIDTAKGFFCGILANLLGIFFWWIFFYDKGFLLMLQQAYQKGILGIIVSLSAIFDLILFFVFLKYYKYSHAKGVLFYTILVALFSLFLKLL